MNPQKHNPYWFIKHFLFGIRYGYSLCCILFFCKSTWTGYGQGNLAILQGCLVATKITKGSIWIKGNTPYDCRGVHCNKCVQEYHI